MSAAAQVRRRTGARAALLRLDVQRGGGPFVPDSFHETFDDAFDRGLAIFGVEDGDSLPAGNDFVVREPVTP